MKKFDKAYEFVSDAVTSVNTNFESVSGTINALSTSLDDVSREVGTLSADQFNYRGQFPNDTLINAPTGKNGDVYSLSNGLMYTWYNDTWIELATTSPYVSTKKEEAISAAQEYTDTKASSVKSEAISSAKEYTGIVSSNIIEIIDNTSTDLTETIKTVSGATLNEAKEYTSNLVSNNAFNYKGVKGSLDNFSGKHGDVYICDNIVYTWVDDAWKELGVTSTFVEGKKDLAINTAKINSQNLVYNISGITLTEAKTYTDNAKDAAINTASADATLKATNAYNSANAYTDAQIISAKNEDQTYTDDQVAGSFKFIKSVNCFEDLINEINVKDGYVYLIQNCSGEVNVEFVKHGTEWIKLGYQPDLSNYYIKSEVNSAIDTAIAPLALSADVYNKSEIDIKESNVKTYAVTQATTQATKAYDDAVNYVTGYTYSKEVIDGKVAGLFHYKGTKEVYSALPTDAIAGDVWTVITGLSGEFNVEYVKTDDYGWISLGNQNDMSAYATNDSVDSKITTAKTETKTDLTNTISTVSGNTLTEAKKYSKEYTDKQVSGSFKFIDSYPDEITSWSILTGSFTTASVGNVFTFPKIGSESEVTVVYTDKGWIKLAHQPDLTAVNTAITNNANNLTNYKAEVAAEFNQTSGYIDSRDNTIKQEAITAAKEQTERVSGLIVQQSKDYTNVISGGTIDLAKKYTDDQVSGSFKYMGIVSDKESVNNANNGQIYQVGNDQWLWNNGSWILIGSLSGQAIIDKITAAKEAAIASAKDYTDGKITTTTDQITNVIKNVSGNTLDLAKDYTEDYAYSKAEVNSITGSVSSSLLTDITTAVSIKANKDDVYTKVEVNTITGGVTNLIANQYYNKTQIDDKLATVFTYKGAVGDLSELYALSGAHTGDVWQVSGMEYIWDGTNKTWQEFGVVVDLEPYAKTTYVDAQDIQVLTSGKAYTKQEIDSLSGTAKEYTDQEIIKIKDEQIKSLTEDVKYLSGIIDKLVTEFNNI